VSSTYSIAIAGIKAGVAKETAIKQLAELLKVSEEKVVSMLNSHKFVVKSGVDLATAAKY
jgi:hydroxymethylpyrimidine pyrophosphatase-like HAD family hydrolase